jgi:hypothetical protein
MDKEPKYGIVVFFEPDYNTGTIKEIGRTDILHASHALHVYAETPNPASQIIYFNDPGERILAENELQRNIKDRAWLDELFQSI